MVDSATGGGEEEDWCLDVGEKKFLSQVEKERVALLMVASIWSNDDDDDPIAAAAE